MTRYTNGHAKDCDYHLDQYPHECTCGVSAAPAPDRSMTPELEALAGQLQLSGWQPIETAPKDGTDILAWCPDYGMRQTRMGRYQPGSPGYAAWERGDGPRNHGWVWIEEKHNSAHSWKPTHWMPLPAAPQVPA